MNTASLKHSGFEGGYFLGFDHQRIIRTLLNLCGVFVVLHLVDVALGRPLWQFERMFDMGLESNLPTWFSGMIWFVASLSAYQCYRLVDSRELKRNWILIALGLLILSLDEIAMIHDHFFEVLSRKFILSSEMSENLSKSAWPIAFTPVLLIAVTWLCFQFKSLFKDSKRAGKLLVFGLVMVIFGAWFLDLTINLLNHETLQWLWDIEVAFEEGFEMLGVITIIAALFAHQRVLWDRKESFA